MMEHAIGTKIMAAVMAGGGAVAATVEVMQAPQRLILGVPTWMLMTAIVGSLIGVLILPNSDTDRVSAPASVTNPWARFGLVTARTGALGAFVLCYAVLAAWTVTVVGSVWPALQGQAGIPLAGIAGVFIRRALPAYLQGVEALTKRLGGKAE